LEKFKEGQKICSPESKILLQLRFRSAKHGGCYKFPDSETGWLVAECPELGTASQGHTEEEALANLREATELYIESFPHNVAV
jgi:hypothetical protein